MNCVVGYNQKLVPENRPVTTRGRPDNNGLYSFSTSQLSILSDYVCGFPLRAESPLAGGGSNLSLPMLMIMGLPADIANATNRVAVLMQCLVGVAVLTRVSTGSTSSPPNPCHTLAGGAAGADCRLFAKSLSQANYAMPY